MLCGCLVLVTFPAPLVSEHAKQHVSEAGPCWASTVLASGTFRLGAVILCFAMIFTAPLLIIFQSLQDHEPSACASVTDTHADYAWKKTDPCPSSATCPSPQ